MRKTLLLLALLLVPLSLEAQKGGKRPRDRILAEELAEHKDASLTEVIRSVRPHFFMPDQTRIDFGLQTQWRVLVYVGSQQRGDSSILKHIKASEVEEIRYYKPNEANTRLGADNASVIQLTMKKPAKS
jgi:hypothetical protein